MESNARWTAMAAVILSAGALGLSVWVAACQTQAPAPSHPAPIISVASQAASSGQPSAAQDQGAPAVSVALPAVASSATAAAPVSKPVVSSQAQLQVKRLVVARGVKGREPVGLASSFALGADPIYAFIEVQNASPEDGAIVVTFERAGVRAGNVNLAVPGNQTRWRTWGWSKGVKEPGEWIAVVRSSGGRELARTAFEVTES